MSQQGGCSIFCPNIGPLSRGSMEMTFDNEYTNPHFKTVLDAKGKE